MTGGATMFKKGMLAMLVILMLMTQFIVVAEDTVEEPYVYIISPKVGDSGKTILNETLFISIYIKSKEPLILELVKKPVYDFEVAVESSPIDSDFMVEEKISLTEIQNPKINYKKSEIIESYDEASLVLEEAKIAYDLEQTKFSKNRMSKLDFIDVQKLNSAQRLIYAEYTEAKTELNKALLAFRFWKSAYLDLFDKTIFNNVAMSVKEAFPYFEYSHNNIEPGHYKLSVKTAGGLVLEKLEFQVVTEQSIANEIINNRNFFGELLQPQIFE